MLDHVLKLAMLGAAVLGLITAGRWIDSARHPLPLPRPGVVCWRVERTTSAGSTFSRRCALEDGWHWEEWPGVAGRVPVPDDAEPVRRRYVRD